MHTDPADSAARRSVLEQYHAHIGRHASPFVEVPCTVRSHPEAPQAPVQRRYRPHAAVGRGWVDMHTLGNGLTIARLHCHFGQPIADRHEVFPDSLRLGLLLAGHERIVNHRGDVLEGQPGDIVVRNGDPGPLRTWVPAGQPHCAVALDVPRAMVQTLVEQGTPLEHLGRPGSCALLHPHGSMALRLRALCQQMMELQTEAHLLAQLELEALALELLLRVLKTSALPPTAAPAPASSLPGVAPRWRAALEQALEILHAEWQRPLTIAQLARRAGLNESYLKELFPLRTGHTVAAYLRQLRMQHARRMLEQDGCTLQQVAQACGYARADKFSQAFRRQYGIAPSQLRQRGRDRE